MILFGRTLLDWCFSLALAVLAFFLVRWLLPLFLGMLHLSPPDPIVPIVALVVAIGVLVGYPRIRGTVV